MWYHCCNLTMNVRLLVQDRWYEFWCSVCRCFFFFKQKTAYEMRISDWSSDVCSSDLIRVCLDGSEIGPRRLRSGADMHLPAKHVAARARIRLPEAQVHLPKAVRLWAVRGKVRNRVRGDRVL